MSVERELGEGLHETDANGDTITVNSTNDPAAGENGFYVSQNVDGEKTTNVYDSDYNLVASKP